MQSHSIFSSEKESTQKYQQQQTIVILLVILKSKQELEADMFRTLAQNGCCLLLLTLASLIANSSSIPALLNADGADYPALQHYDIWSREELASATALQSETLSEAEDAIEQREEQVEWIDQGIEWRNDSEANAATAGDRSRHSKVLKIFPVPVDGECISDDGRRTGSCFNPYECRAKGGTAKGECALGFGVCCVFVANCNETISNNITYLVSPNFPSFMANNFTACTFKLKLMSEDISQLRIDFQHFSLGQPNRRSGVCDGDAFNVSGGQAGTFTLCGQNSGQHMYYDVAARALPRQALYGSLRPLAFEQLYPNISSTPAAEQLIEITMSFTQRYLPIRLWEIRIVQIPFSQRAPAGCLQYHTGTQGILQTFNFAENGRHLANQRYRICMRQEREMCSIMYEPCDEQSFRIGPNGNMPMAGMMGGGSGMGGGTGGGSGMGGGTNGGTGGGAGMGGAGSGGTGGAGGMNGVAMVMPTAVPTTNPTIMQMMISRATTTAPAVSTNGGASTSSVPSSMASSVASSMASTPSTVAASTAADSSSSVESTTAARSTTAAATSTAAPTTTTAASVESSTERATTTTSTSTTTSTTPSALSDDLEGSGDGDYEDIGGSPPERPSRRPRPVRGGFDLLGFLRSAFDFGLARRGQRQRTGRQFFSTCSDRITMPCIIEDFIGAGLGPLPGCEPVHCGAQFCSSGVWPCRIESTVTPFYIGVNFGSGTGKGSAEDNIGACLRYAQVQCL